MAEVAKGAQFAMGTVYRFFKSKEEIYISIVEAKVEELAELLDEAELGLEPVEVSASMFRNGVDSNGRSKVHLGNVYGNGIWLKST